MIRPASSLSFLSLVAVASLASAEVVKFALVPDIQHGTWCTNATTAWDYTEALFDELASRGDIDFVVQMGDIVEEFAYSNPAFGGGECYCPSVDPSPGVCADIVHPIYGAGVCPSWSCADPEAIPCDGGTPGLECEWSRAATLRQKLVAAGIPFFFNTGNHGYDTNMVGNPFLDSPPAWTLYEKYFGPGHFSTDVEDMGYLVVRNSGTASAPAVWQTFRAGGILWLHVGLPVGPWWIPGRGSAEDRSELIAWAASVVEAHPGLPTFFTGHKMFTFDGSGPSSLDCGFCQDVPEFEPIIQGHLFINEIAEKYPQVLGGWGGHDRGLRHGIHLTAAGNRVLGILVDWSFGATDVDPASWIYTTSTNTKSSTAVYNGGGGMVLILQIDPVAGRFDAFGYSPKEKADTGAGRDVRYGEFGALWSETIPICDAPRRFTLPAGACPPPAPDIGAFAGN